MSSKALVSICLVVFSLGILLFRLGIWFLFWSPPHTNRFGGSGLCGGVHLVFVLQDWLAGGGDHSNLTVCLPGGLGVLI